MAYSAFKLSREKRIPDSIHSNCFGEAVINPIEKQCSEVTKISDEVTLVYEPGAECPAVGDIVRFNSLYNAYSLADARIDLTKSDPEERAEALGVVEKVIPHCGGSGEGPVRATIVFFGKVDFTDHMQTKTLTPGRVYYLADTTDAKSYDPAGEAPWQFRRGTLKEPEEISKPIYIATGHSTAIVVNFRGLMGGLKDNVGDIIDATTTCREFGFHVVVENKGSSAWERPITRMTLILDELDGEYGSIPSEPANFAWFEEGTLNDQLGTYTPDERGDPFLSATGAPTGWRALPGERRSFWVGSRTKPAIGKLITKFFDQDIPRAISESRCVPHLEVTPSCGSLGVAPSFVIEHLSAVDLINPIMPDNIDNLKPIKYRVQEKDGDTWVDLQVADNEGGLADEGEFILPDRDETGDIVNTAHKIDIHDAVGSSQGGEYRISFTNVTGGHWAESGPETTLAIPYELSCKVDCGCDEDNYCLVFPDDPDRRKTYGPSDVGYDLGSGLVETADGYPRYARIVGDIQGWTGEVSRGGASMCGTGEGGDGTPALKLNPSFKIPANTAVCIPKLYEADVNSSAGWKVDIFLKRGDRRPCMYLGFGDVPKDITQTANVLLDFTPDDVGSYIGTWGRCFPIALTGSNSEYYLDEEFPG